MNRFHKWYCRSGHWQRKIENEVFPWTLRDIDLGDSVLEIGPGPGVTTDCLRNRAEYIECLEIDPKVELWDFCNSGKRLYSDRTVDLAILEIMPILAFTDSVS